MNLTLTASGSGGHTVVTCEGSKVLVNFHKTDPKERGMIEALVDKGQKLGLKLHRSKRGETGETLEKLLDVLMDPKGEIAMVGAPESVATLACELVDDEVRKSRIVAEAQEDGSWKILRVGDFKKDAEAKGGSKDDLHAKPEEAAKADPEKKPEEPEKKRAVTSHEKVGAG